MTDSLSKGQAKDTQLTSKKDRQRTSNAQATHKRRTSKALRTSKGQAKDKQASKGQAKE